MSSILTSPPAVEPVSLAEAKGHLRVGHADEDALIGTLIVTARRHVEAQTGLRLIAQEWSHFRDDWPGDGVAALPLAPLLAVGDVKTHGEDDIAAVIDPAHYYVDAFGRPPRLLLRGSRVWARPGRIGNGIEIELTAGFGSLPSDVPEDLRQAILQLVAHWYENRGSGREPQVPLTVTAIVERFREKRL
jgi:uncharacterized phiE125 gp8 family phage protein